jgi:hypothetical protein
MCYWVLAKSGEYLSKSAIQQVFADELATEAVQQQLKGYEAELNTRLDRGVNNIYVQELGPGRVIDLDDPAGEPYEPEATQPEADEMDTEAYDQYISAQVLLPTGDTMKTGKVLKRKLDGDGRLIGRANSNPLLDSRVYEVEFSDGTVKEYAANLVAEAIFAQVDDEGRQFVLIDSIIDHQSDGSAIQRDDMYVVHQGNAANDERVEIPGAMEGRDDYMGTAEGPEGVQPD